MVTWVKPNKSKIKTTDDVATRKYAASLGWKEVKLTKAPAKAAKQE